MLGCKTCSASASWPQVQVCNPSVSLNLHPCCQCSVTNITVSISTCVHLCASAARLHLLVKYSVGTSCSIVMSMWPADTQLATVGNRPQLVLSVVWQHNRNTPFCHDCCHCMAGRLLTTSDWDPKLMDVLTSVSEMTTSRTLPELHSAAPPAASMTKPRGAASYSSLSFAGADAETGLAKIPPPWSTIAGRCERFIVMDMAINAQQCKCGLVQVKCIVSLLVVCLLVRCVRCQT